ncbi:hypothetical protein C1645_849842 [Glomus cerebriforme]|uniref:Uncharacterized protein n=1 Tax=Glomus cerebriforme TaxID=658196 RepID=A0A397T4V5_9GLOM|nr:hypothetical protein C1645_849842 [Glomus cerebriforme]
MIDLIFQFIKFVNKDDSSNMDDNNMLAEIGGVMDIADGSMGNMLVADAYCMDGIVIDIFEVVIHMVVVVVGMIDMIIVAVLIFDSYVDNTDNDVSDRMVVLLFLPMMLVVLKQKDRGREIDCFKK